MAYLGIGVGLTHENASAAAPFDPSQVANLLVWYRADKGKTLNAGNVAELDDQSGAGDANRNLVQATASAQPPWNASDVAFNGQASIGPYNATNADTLQANGVWTTPPPSNGTIFMVFKTGSSGLEIFTADHNNGNQYELYQNTPTNLHFFVGSGVDHGTNVANMQNVHVYGVDLDGVGLTAAVSQDAITPVGSFTIGATTATGVWLGRPGFFSGSWAEYIIYNRRLTGTEFSKVMNYLGTRYGISIGP